jgi:4'-phosphopantetheinyl transferase
MPDLLSLAPGEVHVWLTTPESITDPALLARYAAWMNPEEAARQARFLFDRHRLQFLVARALVRTTLSRYADRDPAAWRFVHNQWGRPDLDPEHVHDGLRFNLSHTDGLVAVAIARGDPELGVDVEDTWRRSHTDQIADHFFAPAEVAALRALPQERQHGRFFELWTLKEAYIKARGMGLAISLHHFAYALDGDAVALSVDAVLGDSADGWQFALQSPTSRHRLALAVRFPDRVGMQLRVAHVVPGVDGA